MLCYAIFKSSTKRPMANQLNYIKAIEEYTHMTFRGRAMFEAGEYLDFEVIVSSVNKILWYITEKEKIDITKQRTLM